MKRAIIGFATAMAVVGAVSPLPNAAATATDAGFVVDVTLSTKAAARLAELGESIELSAYWYGEATKAARRQADEVGQITLGDEKHQISGSGGRAVFSGASFDRRRLRLVTGGRALMNLNVYTARRRHPDNLLSCDLFDDDMALAAAKPIAIHCKLIEEH
jgi:hypothetical protein